MDIYFHLPDLIRHYRLHTILYETMQKNPQYFYDNVKIGSVFGVFPTALWNGGRFLNGNCDDRTIKLAIQEYNRRGIPVRFTFTNPMLTEKHLGDPYCNHLLRLANNGFNEVIVNSPMLEEYIRKNYPDYPITSSTCKEIRDADALNAELEKDYKLVVLDYNWNNNYEFLEKLNHKDKCEILIDACCQPNCPRRGEHYRYIGQQQIEYDKHKYDNPPYEIKDFGCKFPTKNFYDIFESNKVIPVEELYNKYVPMGYNQFKLEGRTNSDMYVLESYVYYMVKPEYKDKARLEMSDWLTDRVKFFN